jgi:hypothetical protein
LIAFVLVTVSNGKINQSLSSFSNNSISGHEALQKIFEEHKKLEKQLGELLVGSSTSSQQQTNSPLPSL